MSWRDQMAPATFRGVPFHVEVAERAGGRRTVLHEYPLRDQPFVEDMGLRARLFPVEAYVLGDDYLVLRDNLLAALETAGPGELVHPYYGTRRVICVSFRVRESRDDGGMARFAIDFGETESKPQYPTAAPAAAAKVDASGDAIVAAIRARLAARRAANLPASSFASLSSIVSSAAQSLGAALAPIVEDTQGLAALKRDLDDVLLDSALLVRQPTLVLDRFLGALALVVSPSIAARALVDALLSACTFVPSIARPPATTATRIQEQEEYDLLLWLVRTIEVTQAAQLAAAAEYDSYDAAVQVRDAVGDQLDAQLDGADDETFAALEQLRADLARAVPGEDSDLPRLMRYTPAYTVPSLVLAHRLYGDLSREGDLVTRNAVSRPGFVRGGSELEVLSA